MNINPMEVISYGLMGLAVGSIACRELYEYRQRKNAAAALRDLQDNGKVIINQNYQETKKIADDALFFFWDNDKRTAFTSFIFLNGKDSVRNIKRETAEKSKIALTNYNLGDEMPVNDNMRRQVLFGKIELTEKVIKQISARQI